MTLNEVEEIERHCKAAGSAFDYDPTGRKALLARAAEAIEWLIEELNKVDSGYFELEDF